MIVVWKFDEAPLEYRKLSTNGGDEDWLAKLGPNDKVEEVLWAGQGSPFGVFNVEVVTTRDGVTFLIGSHS